jgi:hypothetical protein
MPNANFVKTSVKSSEKIFKMTFARMFYEDKIAIIFVTKTPEKTHSKEVL